MNYWYVLLYFLPVIVAFYLARDNILAIGVCNLLTGWTGIGWIFSLIWAFKVDQPSYTPAERGYYEGHKANRP